MCFSNKQPRTSRRELVENCEYASTHVFVTVTLLSSQVEAVIADVPELLPSVRPPGNVELLILSAAPDVKDKGEFITIMLVV